MKQVLVDCDNTMGIPGCDVDDGLALLYLLGKKDINIVGITTTYGNSDIDTVHVNTETLLQEIGRTDIKLVKGCPNHQNLESDAVDYILQTVDANRGKISILAIGSLTNLYAAFQKDNSLFAKVQEIILMGGITEPLMINGKVLDELNFSCDPRAAECVLKYGKNVSVITGNNCLDAFFTQKEFEQRLIASDEPAAQYIAHKCRYWFEDMVSRFDINGFHNWDVVAAAFLANPSLFDMATTPICLHKSNLQKGYMVISEAQDADLCIHLPKMKDINLFTKDVYNAWLHVNIE